MSEQQESGDEIIARAKRGDRGAAGQLYELLKTSAWHTAYRALRDPSQAEDVVAETFVAMINQLESIPDNISGLAGWIRVVALNKCRNLIRQSTTRRNGQATLHAIRNQHPQETAPETLDRHETRQQVSEELDRLPDDLRLAIQYRYLDGLSVEAVATRLNRSVAATNSVLFRARERLRETLKRRLRPDAVDTPVSSVKGGNS